MATVNKSGIAGGIALCFTKEFIQQRPTGIIEPSSVTANSGGLQGISCSCLRSLGLHNGEAGRLMFSWIDSVVLMSVGCIFIGIPAITKRCP